MCEHSTRAAAMMAAYREELVTDPTKRREALAAMFALRSVFGDENGDDTGTIGAACALPRPAEEAALCAS